jgi:hypothetical protein
MTNRSPAAMLGLLLGFAPGLFQAAAARDLFVVKDNPDARPPYDSWATAAPDIQTAVDAAAEGPAVLVRSSEPYPILAERSFRAPGDTVWVRAGVYDTGGRPCNRWRMAITNRVAIDKAIVVRSEKNDPAHTIIRGVHDPVSSNGPGAVRCVYLADGATLIGFTLTGGATRTTNDAGAFPPDQIGGGLLAQSSQAVVSNCVLAGNTSFGDPRQSGQGAGGAYGGKFFDCEFRGNTTRLGGGGASHAMLFRCTIAGNACGNAGGGVNGGFLSDCLVVSNTAAGIGGGACAARLERCALLYNGAGHLGGGYGLSDPIQPPNALLTDCLVAFNHSDRGGGGVRGATLRNCLVISNTAPLSPGLHQCAVSDSLVLFNGSSYCRFDNCLLVGDGAQALAPSSEPAVRDCTIVGTRGPGLSAFDEKPAQVLNSISWGNGAPDRFVAATGSRGVAGPHNNYADPGAGNATNAPAFVNAGVGAGHAHVPGDYRLQPGSAPQPGCRLGPALALTNGLARNPLLPERWRRLLAPPGTPETVE